MITIPLMDIKAKIKEESSLSEEDINKKIQDKLEQLSGLISEEGAAHIIANELGIKLAQQPEKGENIQVKNILAGMRNVSIVGKVTRKFEIREFQTETRSGKVANLMFSDETGVIRLVMWNDQTDKFNVINEGDILAIENGYVRENNGRKEIHLNDNSILSINPEGVEVKNVQESVVRKKLSELTQGDDNVEVLATIVQVFDIKFFEIDPNTGRRVIQKEGKYYSGDKEITDYGYAYVTNLFLDDGTENIRTVLWRNQIQKLLGLSNEEVLKFRTEPTGFESIKTDLLGTIVKVVGRVNKNENFDRLELVANLIYKDVDPEEEIKKLESEKKDERSSTTTIDNSDVVPEPDKEENQSTEESTVQPKTEDSEPIMEEEVVEDDAVEKAIMETESENSQDELSIKDLEKPDN